MSSIESTPPGTETTRKRKRSPETLTIVTLYLAGFYFLVVPLVFPDALGWTMLTERFGASAILCFAVGFQFLYIALLTRDKYRTRQLTLDTLEALNQFLFGADYQRHREAVDLLIRGLGTSDASARRHAVKTLESMTGQGFGEDQAKWVEWWATHRSRFRARTGAESGEGYASANPTGDRET